MYTRNFKSLALFCCCTCQFMSDLVGNPEDRFSRIEAHLEFVFCQEIHAIICYHMYMYYQNHIFCYCMFKNLCHFSTKILVYYIVNNKSCNSLCMRILSRDAWLLVWLSVYTKNTKWYILKFTCIFKQSVYKSIC